MNSDLIKIDITTSRIKIKKQFNIFSDKLKKLSEQINFNY